MSFLNSYITRYKESYILTRMAFSFRLLGAIGYGILSFLHIIGQSYFVFSIGTAFYILWLIWPFFALYITLNSEDQKRSELRNTLFDPIVVFLGALAGLPIFIILFGFYYVLVANLSIGGIKHGIKTFIIYTLALLAGWALGGFQLKLFSAPLLTYSVVIFGTITLVIVGQVGAVRVRSAKHHATALIKEQKYLDSVSDILTSIGPEFELKQLMIKVLKALQESMTFDGMLVFVCNNESQTLSQQFIYSKFKEDNEITSLPPLFINTSNSSGYLVDAFNRNEPSYHESINPAAIKSPEDIQLFSMIPYSSLLAIPILVGQQKIGMMVFLFRSNIQAISRQTISKAEQYIYHISHLLNNELLYKESVNISSQIQRKNEALYELSQQVKKYLSPQITRYILTNESSIEKNVARKWLTVYCSDIENFTQITEQLAPEELQHLLNSYLEAMTDVAIRFGGTIDKYIGDMITVFFGDPETRGPKQDALDCVHMAMAMNDALNELREKWLEQGIVQTFKIRNAISSGILLVGNIGGDLRQDYTLYGDDMTYAMMLQSKAEAGSILLTETTHDLVKNEIECIPFDKPIKFSSCNYQNYKAIGDYSEAKLKSYRIHEKNDHFSFDIFPEKVAISDRNFVEKTFSLAKSALESRAPFHIRLLENLKLRFKHRKTTD